MTLLFRTEPSTLPRAAMCRNRPPDPDSWRQATFRVPYGGHFGSGVSDQSVKANFNATFRGRIAARFPKAGPSRTHDGPEFDAYATRRGEVPHWRPRKLLFAPPRLRLSASCWRYPLAGLGGAISLRASPHRLPTAITIPRHCTSRPLRRNQMTRNRSQAARAGHAHPASRAPKAHASSS
jgi:hypothetical protein